MVIFGAGVITGGLLVHQTTGKKSPRMPRSAYATNMPPQTVTPSQMTRMEFLVRANRELELTPQQRERIERVLREGQERSRQIWESVAPDMRKELQLVRERIKAELTPEQRRRFEDLMKKQSRPGLRPGASGEMLLNSNAPARMPRRQTTPLLTNAVAEPPSSP